MEKLLTCQVCGKKYPWSEFKKIQEWITIKQVFPPYKELLVCWECWSEKYK
jgi:hypothetical protein